jgi:hypothetical protein
MSGFTGCVTSGELRTITGLGLPDLLSSLLAMAFSPLPELLEVGRC